MPQRKNTKKPTVTLESQPPNKKQKTVPAEVPVEAKVVATNTLYIRNLNDKLPKESLKNNLYILFATYGDILEISAPNNTKMRGQAHIVFADIKSAKLAMRHLQKETFFGKELVIEYSRAVSHTITKLDGTFQAKSVAMVEE